MSWASPTFPGPLSLVEVPLGSHRPLCVKQAIAAGTSNPSRNFTQKGWKAGIWALPKSLGGPEWLQNNIAGLLLRGCHLSQSGCWGTVSFENTLPQQ